MLISALIFGLLGSFHCIGMCGPIAFMLPVDRTNPTKQFFQIMSYHIGRLTTYAIIGLLFGLLGKGFQLFGFQQQISIITGTLMILTILLPKLFNNIKLSKSITRFVFKIKSALGKELKNKNNNAFFTIGFLNGYLPCGLVYMAVLGALSSTNPFTGSLYMLLFGLGTIPLMTSVVYMGNFASGLFRKRIQQIIPIIVVCIGILFVLRGLGLGIPLLSPPDTISTLNETAKGCH
ncbi:hypothetical protein C7447_10467 [Tenacibaculum adriaticum]|uniref:Urease accessory protein UreH-like transmembrane domain-containing protein n=1 Tax=Tenacibaculum adriaticum TaxID=413713 RepID=A0A5S5DR91_9FLAO|nr:sulfite exporter TauE/SafE family protein [Tenacibaculum adriaticum]TYP97382.1 hypothetical protein C7447_10467 [Tenacibaculum adriaticum]